MHLLSCCCVVQVGECVINKLGTVVDVELSWCKSYVDVCIVGWWLLSLFCVVQVGECVINKLDTVVVIELSWCKSYVDVCIVGWWLLSVMSCCMLIYTVGV